jgi:hypothetical protein
MDDKKLEEETIRWLKRLEEEMKKTEINEKSKKTAKEILENIRAYISDSKHFLGKKDYLNAYEAVIYAWGMYETALRVRLIVKNPDL